MSRHVTRLVRAGLVRRTAGAGGDRRRVGLELTAEAERVLRLVRSRRTAWLVARLQTLDDEALRSIDDAIEPLRHADRGRAVTAALLRLNRRTFASLKHRNYRLFFVGQVVSVTGTWMQNIAMAWLVLELTGSPVAVGVLVLCQFLPFSDPRACSPACSPTGSTRAGW